MLDLLAMPFSKLGRLLNVCMAWRTPRMVHLQTEEILYAEKNEKHTETYIE
jgi:hypothetical protein